jgi:hypothetical protein
MAKRSYRDLFIISRSGYGYILELFLKIRGASYECVDRGLIMEKGRGLFVKLEFSWIKPNYFCIE